MNKIAIESRKVHKNTDGHLGPICNNCGGYGFTLSIVNGQSTGCHDCNQTGVAQLSIQELTNMVLNLAAELQGLKNIITREIKRSKQ